MTDSSDHLRHVAADLIERAKTHGVTSADVLVAEGDSVSVQVRLSSVDRLSKAREKSLGIRVFFGKRSASSSTSDFTPKSLDQLVADTCTLAKAVAEDETSGLPDAAAMASDHPELDLFDPTTLSMDEEISLARRAEDAAMAADARITNSEGADCAYGNGLVVLANTHGFLDSHRSSRFSLSVTPIAVDEKNGGGMQRDSWYTVQRKYSLLDSPETIGQIAAQRTVRRLGAKKVSTQRVPVIFDPEMAESLLGHLATAVSGYSLYKGASFLLGQLGQRIAPEFVSVIDDGRMVGGLGSRPFDGEGLATRKNVVLDRGVLSSYLLDTYSGKKLGMPSTGNAARSIGENPSVSTTNFFLQPGTTTPKEIIGSVKQGLYVTELIGFGVNMVTGDYSRGASGFWIENGELAYPVEEVTIAGNLKRIFEQIEVIGNDLEFRGRMASPTVKIAEMTVAGN
ncbi:TldD/PmbA family protein [Candidatus Nitronereus thalassa]|uniref:Metallopeptidase TldD-related protein n=1 Tax=Candidatus Nitronereus thalassa TaxID=3020898 RepID=A0ABU3K6E4_9BACT|nr:metallopeptidase TldD-related protein [Candidatus Nitronereus thalassa]MDT7041946.1 metallopeptidase TldD-related protein [Candidatus Nitronereus thalassa]